MARYRIHRMKDSPREAFRWAAHTGGLALVKPRDYDPDGEIEAATPYAAWRSLASAGRPLSPGDLLETLMADASPGDLQIFKYIGFEAAKWNLPELKPESELSPNAIATPVNPGGGNQESQPA